MSLILEALRKSEAQRRLGQAPDLLAPTPDRGVPARQGLPAWPWFVAGLVLVAATAWWLGRQTPLEPARVPASVDEPVRTPQSANADGPAETRSADRTAALQPGSAAQSAPAEVMGREEPGPADEVAAPPRPPPSMPGATSSLSSSQPASATATPDVAVSASDGPASAGDLAQLRARLEAVAQRETASEQSRATAEVEQAPAPAGSIPGAAGPIRRFEELSPGERNGLPDMKFSLHVFADDAAGRFVVLGGRRLGEGAVIGPRARIAEIRRDGAVIEIDGHPVLVGRP